MQSESFPTKGANPADFGDCSPSLFPFRKLEDDRLELILASNCDDIIEAVIACAHYSE